MPLPDDDVLPQRLGVEVGVVGLGADRGRVAEHLGAGEASRARATSGNHSSQQVGSPSLSDGSPRPQTGIGLVGRARPEVLVLVVAGGDRDVGLAGAGHDLPARGHDDGGVEAEPVALVGSARRARRGRGRRSRGPRRGRRSPWGPSRGPRRSRTGCPRAGCRPGSATGSARAGRRWGAGLGGRADAVAEGLDEGRGVVDPLVLHEADAHGRRPPAGRRGRGTLGRHWPG